MGRRAKVKMLPEKERVELNRYLVEHGFGNYEMLSRLLSEHGFRISRSALQRWGSGFERKLDAVELASAQAREVIAASPDTEGAFGDALVRLVQSEIFKVLVECKGQIEKPDLARIARAVSDLGRTTVRQRKWAEDVRVRLESQKRAADGQIGEVAREHGLSPQAAQEIRQILLGINPLDTRAGN
jgi:uncharacterized protein DUF3486